MRGRHSGQRRVLRVSGAGEHGARLFRGVARRQRARAGHYAAQGQADHPRLHRLEGEIMGQTKDSTDEGHGDESLAVCNGGHHDRGACIYEGDRRQDPQTGV